MRYKLNKKHIGIFILITLGVVIYFYGSEMSAIAGTLKHINWWYMWMAMACMTIYWLMEARTLQLMLQAFVPNIHYGEVVKLVMATQFFNGITPFSTGGQPFQIYVLSKKKDLHVSSVTSASIHNFIMYQLVLVIMGVCALIFARFIKVIPLGQNVGWMVIFGFALNVGVVIVLLTIAFLPKVSERLVKLIHFMMDRSRGLIKKGHTKKQLDHKIAVFRKEIWQVIADPELFVKALFLNALKLLSLYSVTYFLCLTLGITTMSLLEGIVISAYVMLMTSMVPVPGATGGAELGYVVLFGTVIGAQITVLVLLWRFVTYYVGMIIGSMVYYFAYVSD